MTATAIATLPRDSHETRTRHREHPPRVTVVIGNRPEQTAHRIAGLDDLVIPSAEYMEAIIGHGDAAHRIATVMVAEAEHYASRRRDIGRTFICASDDPNLIDRAQRNGWPIIRAGIGGGGRVVADAE